MDLLEFFSQQLEYYKMKKRMTTYMLISMSGLNISVIRRIQNKESIPTVETIQKLCDGFGITMSQFFAGDAEKIRQFNEAQSDVMDYMDQMSSEQQQMMVAYAKGIVDTNIQRSEYHEKYEKRK